MARPRSLDDVKRREVCALVSTGCSLSTAARYVGCASITIRREALRNNAFYEQLRQAEMARQVRPLNAIRKAAETHWRAAAWLLERCDPDQFARRKPKQLTPDQLEQILADGLHVVKREIADDDIVDRIFAALTVFERGVIRNVRAAERPIPDRRHRRHDALRASLPLHIKEPESPPASDVPDKT